MSKPRRLKVIIEADGGARGNPGPAGYGAVVREAVTGETLVERAESIGVATNNVAEYSGLIAGLQAAADLGAVEVEARMDSKLVVEQMSGRWQIKNSGLRPLAAKAAGLVGRFESVRFTWVPREHNRRADALANAAMDGRPAPEDEPEAVATARSSEQRREAATRITPDAARASVRESSSEQRREAATRITPDAARASVRESSTANATRLILVRHGETELNAQGRYSGRGDVPLSERGLAQARAVAERLGAMGIDGLVTSPLARSVRTAEAIAAAAGSPSPPLTVEPGLVECDFGEWEGRTFAEVRERYGPELDAWLASPAVGPPGGESFETVAARVRPVLSRLLAEHPGETIVVVSHVTPIKLILRDALAATDAFLHRMFLDATGVSIVDNWTDGGIAVRTVNDTAHLR